jgi:type IV pilus biogenesis protein CpaD/CtpE
MRKNENRFPFSRRWIPAFAGMTVLFLSSCNGLDTPSQINAERVNIEAGQFAQEFPLAELNDAGIKALQQDYARHGNGAAEVTVLYDPKSRSNTAMKASTEATRIADSMRKNGFSDVQIGIMPVKNSGDEAKALVTYNTVSAHAPSSCGDMPTFGPDHDVDTTKDYKFGCKVESMLAKQVSRPADLLGRDGSSAPADGRRISNGLKDYRAGKMNDDLGGMSASGK